MQSPRSPPTSPTQYLAAGTTVETNWSAASAFTALLPLSLASWAELESRPTDSATLHRVPPLPTGSRSASSRAAPARRRRLGRHRRSHERHGRRPRNTPRRPGSAWVTMMAAMMLPSITPMVIAHARLQQARRERGRLAAIGVSAAFVAGYLVTWAAAGLLGYAIFDAVSSLDLGFLAWEDAGPLHLRRRDPRRRPLPADRAQGRLPAPLPQPGDAPRALPSRPPRRAADGHRARRRLRRLLLVADGRALRARGDEHRAGWPSSPR